MARTVVAEYGNGEANPPTGYKTVPVPRVKGTYFNARHKNKIPADDRQRKAALKAKRREQHARNVKKNLLTSTQGGAA
jgi:hypothetical protein